MPAAPPDPALDAARATVAAQSQTAFLASLRKIILADIGRIRRGEMHPATPARYLKIRQRDLVDLRAMRGVAR